MTLQCQRFNWSVYDTIISWYHRLLTPSPPDFYGFSCMRCVVFFVASTIWYSCSNVVFVVCFASSPTTGGSYVDNDEFRLMHMILSKQNRSNILARPLRNSSQSMQVNFKLNIVLILDFDEKNQVISLLIWKHYVSSTRRCLFWCFSLYVSRSFIEERNHLHSFKLNWSGETSR